MDFANVRFCLLMLMAAVHCASLSIPPFAMWRIAPSDSPPHAQSCDHYTAFNVKERQLSLTKRSISLQKHHAMRNMHRILIRSDVSANGTFGVFSEYQPEQQLLDLEFITLHLLLVDSCSVLRCLWCLFIIRTRLIGRFSPFCCTHWPIEEHTT